MTVTTESAEQRRVLVTFAGHPIIEADRASWFANAIARQHRSCQVTIAPYVADADGLVDGQLGDRA